MEACFSSRPPHAAHGMHTVLTERAQRFVFGILGAASPQKSRGVILAGLVTFALNTSANARFFFSGTESRPWSGMTSTSPPVGVGRKGVVRATSPREADLQSSLYDLSI